MNRRPFIGLIAGLIAVVALPVTALAGGEVTNGSFEEGDFTGGAFGFETLVAGSPTASAMTGWTVTEGSVDWIGNLWTAADGAMSLDMNGTPSNGVGVVGAITQTVATTVNNTYVVQFWLAGNPDCGPGTKTLIVSATGAAPVSYAFENTGSTTRADMGWQQMAYPFVATLDSTTLTFAADPNSTSFCGPALDGVTSTETALTGAQCKQGGWRTMHDADGAPFKNQGDCVSFYATSGAAPIGN
jgi:choice-of-anchor C domain-containing protein